MFARVCTPPFPPSPILISLTMNSLPVHNEDTVYTHEKAVDVAEAPVWIPDKMAPRCMICNDHFTVVRRRHHCLPRSDPIPPKKRTHKQTVLRPELRESRMRAMQREEDDHSVA